MGSHERVCGQCGAPNPRFNGDAREDGPGYEFSTTVRSSSELERAPSTGALLDFRLAGVPVSVHWSFLVIALLAAGVYEGVEIVAWTVAVFAAILLHEAGHALTARRFGASSVSIRLFAFGGATTWDREPALTPGQRFVTTAAGSGVGIIAGALAIAAVTASGFAASQGLLGVLVNSFVWASLVWGGLNWIPILPLDGGQMVHAFLDVLAPRSAHKLARGITVAVGLVVVGALIRTRDWFLVFFAVMIIVAGLRSPGPSATIPDGGQKGRSGRVRTALWMGLALIVAMGAVGAALVLLGFLNIETAFG